MTLSPHIIVWGIFGLIMLYFVFASMILMYHWQTYRVSTAIPRMIVGIYFFIAVIPVVVMIVFALMITIRAGL